MHSRRFPTSKKLILLIGDILLMMLAYVAVNAFVLNRSILLVSFSLYANMMPVIIVIAGLLFNINGLYSIANKRCAEILLSMAIAMAGTAILTMALSFFLREFSYSRGVLLISLGCDFVLLSIWRYMVWRIERHYQDQKSVLLLGSEEECQHVYNRLRLQPQLNMKLRYVCTDLENGKWQEPASKVDILILCSEMRHKDKAAVMNYGYQNDKQVMLIPNSFEIFCSSVQLDKIDDIPVFRTMGLNPSLEVRSLKRILDLVVAVIGFICALPFMLLTAIAIKIGDPGPVFYSQIRTGRYNQPFKVYKFRTMKVDAEKYSGPMLATENDPRITKLGRFLRAVRLDELPQIWNVLIVDMSIVGPRPERPFFVEKYVKEMPEYAYRHNVKPGITGMAQVYGKYNTTAFDKLVYDLMYIQKCSLITDLTIIIQTVRVLFSKSATEGTGIEMEEMDFDKYDYENRD